MADAVHKVLQNIIDEVDSPGQSVRIEPLHRGYKVHVGCAEFAFERLDTCVQAVKEYLIDPHAAIEAYNKHMAEVLGVDDPPPGSQTMAITSNTFSKPNMGISNVLPIIE